MLLVFLSLQGWTGDYVNLFAVFPSGSVSILFGSFIRALEGAGLAEVFHASLGISLLAASVVVLILSFRSKAKSLCISSIIGLAAVASAVVGGLLLFFQASATTISLLKWVEVS